MSYRPILFSAPMVRALLREASAPGTGKTQTRRLARFPQWAAGCFTDPLKIEVETGDDAGHDPSVICEATGCLATLPLFFAVGDRLWVREAWKAHSTFEAASPRDIPPTHVFYLADEKYAPSGSRVRPSIHMPRWASRLTLIVTDVRVQRLAEISEEDALAEGVDSFAESLDRPGSWEGLSAADRVGMTQVLYGSARRGFQHLWEHLHGADAWERNHWVCAISFEVHAGNIDRLQAAAAREIEHV